MKKIKNIILALLLTNNLMFAMQDENLTQNENVPQLQQTNGIEKIRQIYIQSHGLENLSTLISGAIREFIISVENMTFRASLSNDESVDLYNFITIFIKNHYRHYSEETALNYINQNYQDIIINIRIGLQEFLKNGFNEEKKATNIAIYLNANDIREFSLNSQDPISRFFNTLLEEITKNYDDSIKTSVRNFIEVQLSELTEQLNLAQILEQEDNLDNFLDELGIDFNTRPSTTTTTTYAPTNSENIYAHPMTRLITSTQDSSTYPIDLVEKKDQEKQTETTQKQEIVNIQNVQTKNGYLKRLILYPLIPACAYATIKAVEFYYHPEDMVIKITSPIILKTLAVTTSAGISFMERKNIKNLVKKCFNYFKIKESR